MLESPRGKLHPSHADKDKEDVRKECKNVRPAESRLGAPFGGMSVARDSLHQENTPQFLTFIWVFL